ncbi:MAG: hypothetical protein L3K09_03000 [Thermoplasmata archaeon]|nr:hypothetical protein [Thermoplasmata archaeon]
MSRNETRSRHETNEQAAPGGGRWLRRYWPLPAAGTLAVVSLLLMSPVSGATNVASFSAPFTGATAIHHQDAVSQGCGAQLTVSTAASFVLSTGVGTGAASAKSSPCSSSDSQATYDAIVGVNGLAFTPATTGTYTTTAQWNVTWNASGSMSGKAAAAGGQTTVEIWVLVKLHDSTTGKTFVGKTFFVVRKDMTTAAKYSGGKTGALYMASLSHGLTAGDKYQVYAVLGFDIAAVIPQASPAGSVTSAAVDLGSPGHGGTLTSITVA